MASLGKDLAAIRKEQDLSFEDIYEATKIPKHIINSIEDDTIFTDFDENATYIRSYVRSYAKVLSIDEQKIIYALDQQKIGKYSGSLRVSGEIETESLNEDETTEEPTDAVNEADAPSDDTNNTPAPSDESSEREEGTTEKAETTASPKRDTLTTGSASGDSPARSNNVDWASMGRDLDTSPTRSNIWIGIMILVLLLAGGIYFMVGSSGNNETDPQEQGQENEADSPLNESDSLQLNLVPPTEEDTAGVSQSTAATADTLPRESLSDTLEVIVYAAYDKLEPVRVYTDIMGNINPYWIEQGEAVRFDFVNEFRIRGQQDAMVLLMNGHVIEDVQDRFYNPDTRLVEVNRSFFEENDKWLQPSPDSLAIGAPPPAVIRERPTYN